MPTGSALPAVAATAIATSAVAATAIAATAIPTTTESSVAPNAAAWPATLPATSDQRHLPRGLFAGSERD